MNRWCVTIWCQCDTVPRRGKDDIFLLLRKSLALLLCRAALLLRKSLAPEPRAIANIGWILSNSYTNPSESKRSNFPPTQSRLFIILPQRYCRQVQIQNSLNRWELINRWSCRLVNCCGRKGEVRNRMCTCARENADEMIPNQSITFE
jgi:hypothetical protein